MNVGPIAGIWQEDINNMSFISQKISFFQYFIPFTYKMKKMPNFYM